MSSASTSRREFKRRIGRVKHGKRLGVIKKLEDEHASKS